MLSYNGVNFVWGTTTVHVMSPAKDPSNADQLLTTIRLQTRSVIHYPNLTPAQPGDGSTDGTLARLRHLLTAPRRPLYYDQTSLPGQAGNTPVINLPDGRDDGGGPWPDDNAFSATYTTPGTIEVTWACVVKLRDCGTGDPTNPLSLRWEDSVTQDETWKTTYRRTGTLILSSLTGNDIDFFRRNKLCPVVLPGFRRASAQYAVSRDGLRCDFVFSDEQIRFGPPYPAIDMVITQSETFPQVAAGNRKGNVSVVMTGIQSANVVELSRWALYVARARMWAANPLAGAQKKVIGQAALQTRESPGGVDVSCQMTYRVVDDGKQEDQIVFGKSGWSAPLVGAIVQANAPLTQQGRNPSLTPPLPWVGNGTSPPAPGNPKGYADWANPSAAIAGPADGVGLAREVTLFAAMLADPCGEAMKVYPNAAEVVEIRTTAPSTWNTPAGGGNGGTPPTTPAQLSAALTGLTASQYPTALPVTTQTGLYVDDGQPGVYDYWQCQNQYLKDPGVIVIPTCNPDGVNIQVAHSSKMVTLRKNWAACRTGAPPRLPPPVVNKPSGDVDDNWVLTFEEPAVRETKLAADGVSVQYEATGYYEFQALDASKVTVESELPPFVSPELQATRGWANSFLDTLSAAGQGFIDLVTGGPLGSGTFPGPPIF